MTPEQKKFAKQLADQCETRKQWLSVLEFGRETLLSDRDFLLRLIVDRAAWEHRKDLAAGTQSIADIVADITRQLRLALHSFKVDLPAEFSRGGR